MIENITYLLQLDEFKKVSERVEIAKGKYELTTNYKKIWRQYRR